VKVSIMKTAKIL